MLRLSGRPHVRRCAACGAAMRAAGFDMLEQLGAKDLPAALRERPLRSLGLLPGDIVAVRDQRGDRYFELRATRIGE